MCNDCSPDSSTDDLNRNANQDFSQTHNEDTNQGTPGSDSDHPASDVDPQSPDQSKAEEDAGLESREGPFPAPSQDVPEYLITLSNILAKGATAAEQQTYEQTGHTFSNSHLYIVAMRRAMLLKKIAFRKQWSFQLISDEKRVTFIVAILREPSKRAFEYWTEKVADLMLQEDTPYIYAGSDGLITVVSETRRRLWTVFGLAVLSILFMTGILTVTEFIDIWTAIKIVLKLES